MRPRHQQGSIVKVNGQWLVRFYEDRVEDGNAKRVRAARPLAPVNNTYRVKAHVRSLADEVMRQVNCNVATQLDGTLTLAEFVDQRYFPHLEQRLKMTGELHLEPSTLQGYRDIWNLHGKNSNIASVRVRDFSTVHAQSFLMALNPTLTHKTHLRIKALLSGIFNRARQVGAITRTNPLDGTKVGGTRLKFQGHAYSTAEIALMLEKLPEPARTVVAVAAFTGLSMSELRGIRWCDYDGESIQVRQKVWRSHVGDPKTEARSGAVPVIPRLRKILDAYRLGFPPAKQDDFIFRGERTGFALGLNNLARRVIIPLIGDVWVGWHGFRRGLGTRLYYDMDTDAKTVQAILRHANISTTMAHYIIEDQTEKVAAMRKLDGVLDSIWSLKGVGGKGNAKQSLNIDDFPARP
jgi:integrase